MASILYNIILSPITQLIEIAYRVFDKMFDNTGISIIGVSLTVTLLCLPLYIVAEGWQDTERDIQSKMKSGIDRIKKYFKGDEQYMILNTFYRQNHYHPIMALRSSFGILIQIPFFLAAYHTLSALPDLQGKAFLFVKNMGMPDATFHIGSFAVNILPIAMTIINCVSGAIYSKGHGIREKAQIYGMALLFLVVLYNSPAGLVIYWTMNNIFSLVKNIFYKMKNPIKVFYICVCISLSLLALYILFGYLGGAGMKKRLPAALFLLIWLPIPFYLKGINYFLKNQLKPIFENNKTRFSIFIFSAIGLTILNGLVLPSSLISSSVQEFSNIENYTNPNAFLHSSFWMSFGLIVFWPTCIYFLFKEKIQTVLSFLFATFLLGSVVNAYIFNGNYGSMDSTLKLIDGFKNPSTIFMFLNTLAVLLCFVAISLLIKFKFAKIISNAYLITIIAFIALTIVNTTKISKEYKEFQKITLAKEAQDDGLSSKFHLSKTEKNIVIFMLDRFESAFVENILSDQKELKKTLEGFVFYPNCLSFNGHTLMGSPAVYGGYEYSPYEMNKRSNIELKTKHNEALLLLPKILTEQAGFKAVISDLSWANYSYIADMSFAKNIPNVSSISLLSKYSKEFKKDKLKADFSNLSLSHTINRNLFWVSLFREVPSPIRSIIYYKGTWWENGVRETGSSFSDWFSALYVLPRIIEIDSQKPTLSIITNESTHSGEDISMYDIKLNGEYSLNNNSYIIDSVTLNQVGEFCNYLRRENIYDNTRIIIASDHGIGNYDKKFNTTDFDGNSKDKLNPVLLVKDFNSNEEFSINNRFMTNADVPSIALKNIIENPINPFTNKKIDESYKKDGVIATFADIFMPYHSKSKYIFTVKNDEWVKINDNIFIDENWSKLE